MKVLHLSTVDFAGAGTAAYRLHKNLLSQGLDSRMAVMNSRSRDPRVVELVGKRHPLRHWNLVTKAWSRLTTKRKYYFQNQSKSSVSSVTKVFTSIDFEPDVIVAHSISNFFTVKDLHDLSNASGVPIVWYLMDMAPLTGGCHHAWDCVGYLNKCGNCPALYFPSENDLSRKIWRAKHALVQNTNITVVTGTSWLRDQARVSSIFSGKRLEEIMLAVDPEIFKPRERNEVRRKLNLPLDKKIVFFGAQSPKLMRKGMTQLLEALKTLDDKGFFKNNEVVLAVAGNPTKICALFDSVFPYVSLGYLVGDENLAAAYQAADLFVCPSIEDSGPMMINEAIMCGTPVVAFAMGVAPDLVLTGKTGYCAELKNSADLAKGIKYVLDLSPADARKMSTTCMQRGRQLCHPRVQAESFKNLFGSLLNSR